MSDNSKAWDLTAAAVTGATPPWKAIAGEVSQAGYQVMVPFSEYAKLVDIIASMKRDGFNVPVHITEPANVPELPDEVRQAIAQVSEPRSMTARHLTAWAWDQVALKIHPEAIAKEILAGEPAPL